MTQVKTPPRPREKPLKPRDSIYPDSVRKLFPPHFTDGDIAASLEGRPKITKIKKKRKGGNVKGYLAGGLLPPPGAGQGTAPQAKFNPNADKDKKLKDNALKKKQMDIAAAQAKAPPVPGKPGMAPGMAQKPPPVLGRKGGKIKMKRGGPVPKSYSNICRSPVPRA